jgi:cell wall-associated NlpC family hydrolase
MTTTAVALACALTVLTAPGAAWADPGNPSRPPKSDQALEAVRGKLDGLYHDAAVATDAYNAAQEKADQQSGMIRKLSRAVKDGQRHLDELKDRAGAAARAQYRGGGLPPEAQLLLSDDPDQFLDGTTRIRAGAHASEGLLGDLTRTQEALEIYARDATTRGKSLAADREAKSLAKKKVQQKIAEAEKLESRLESEERQRLKKLEQQDAARQQAAWLNTGILDGLSGRASPQGKEAVAYATAQIGKPYQWGAEGPASYDCSGLTSQAWASAGQGIPRTSQEQWRQLPHVPVADMRPGDLIVYNTDASHVALYIGDGTIVHAPRPGRDITTAGAGSMHILGVVRPDVPRGD